MDIMMKSRKRRQGVYFPQGAVRVYNFLANKVASKTSTGTVAEEMTYSCPSELLAQNSSGQYQTFSNNTPALTNRGVKTASSVINLMKSSNDFAQTDWGVAPGSTVISNAEISPDGTMNADKITALSESEYFMQRHLTDTALKTYTASIFVKAEGANIGRPLRLYLKRNSGTWVSAQTTFNLTANWQRVQTTVETLADTDGIRFILHAYDGNPVDVTVWGAQLEEGTYANAPILTGQGVIGSSSETDLIDNVNTHDLSQGSLHFEFEYLNKKAKDNRIVSFTDNSKTFVIALNVVDQIYAASNYYNAGWDADFTSTVLGLTQHKACLKWQGTNVKFYLNGTEACDFTLTQAFSSTDLQKLYFGSDKNGRHSTMNIKSATLYDQALADGKCIELTS